MTLTNKEIILLYLSNLPRNYPGGTLWIYDCPLNHSYLGKIQEIELRDNEIRVKLRRLRKTGVGDSPYLKYRHIRILWWKWTTRSATYTINYEDGEKWLIWPPDMGEGRLAFENKKRGAYELAIFIPSRKKLPKIKAKR